MVEILGKHQEKVSTELAQSFGKRTVEQSLIEWSKIAKHAEKQMIKTPPMIYDLEKYYPQLFKQHKSYMRAATEDILMEFLQKGINEGVFRKEIDIKIVAMDMKKTTNMNGVGGRIHLYVCRWKMVTMLV